MSIIRKSVAEIDRELSGIMQRLEAVPEPTEDQIEAWAEEDDSLWTDEDFAKATSVYPAPSPQETRAARERLGMTTVEFARRFGLPPMLLEAYERGECFLPTPYPTLLRIAVFEPEAAMRALGERAGR